jgi:hypothetical protein
MSLSVHHKRGKPGGLQAAVSVESPQGQAMIKTDRAVRFIHAATFVWYGVIVWWRSGGLYGHEAWEADEFISLLGDDHCYGQILTMTLDMFCGVFLVYLHDAKKWQMSCHILWLPPWCSICRNCIGLIQEVHIWMRSGGSFNCRLLFFQSGTLLVTDDWRWTLLRRKLEYTWFILLSR